MQKHTFTKKWLSLFLALLLTCSVFAPAAAAASVGQKEPVPIIFIIGRTTLYKHLSEPKNRQAVPDSSSDEVTAAVKEALPYVAKAVLLGQWDEYADKAYELLMPFFEDYGLDENGNVCTDTGPTYSWSEENLSRDYASEDPYTYRFEYDCRLSPLEIADDLNDFIEAVKRVTGYDIEGHAKEAGGFIHLINSGACCLDACGEVKDDNGNAVIKPWYDVTEQDIETMLKATEWCAADNGYFRGGGYSSRFLTRAEMPATMIRLNLVKGLGPTIQIAEGYTVGLPDEVSDILWKRTDYTWPCTWFTPICTGVGPFRSAYDLMNCWGANHGAISYGHIGADLITLCSMLRIPVGLHNVPDEKIFRPAAWNAFGTKDLEGADYRACAAYGPLYK